MNSKERFVWIVGRSAVLCIMSFAFWLWMGQLAMAGEITGSTSNNQIEQGIYEELLHGYDFSLQNRTIEDYLPDLNMTMEDMLGEIIYGGELFSPPQIVNIVWTKLKDEIAATKNLFWIICLCAVMSALATNIAGLCENKQTVQLGMYAIYLILLVYLLETFLSSFQIAKKSLEDITGFLNVFLPTYYFSVGLSIGTASSYGFYRLSIWGIYIVEYVMYLVLIPLDAFYFLLSVCSAIAPGDRMASLLSFMKKMINIILKTCMTAIGGLGAIRMLILPMTDSVSYGSAKKIISSIPGIGSVSDVTIQMVGSSLLLIKNGIGVVIMILLILLALVPLIRLISIALVVRLGGAFHYLVGGGNLNKLIERTSSAITLLIKIVGSSYALNILVLAIVAACK